MSTHVWQKYMGIQNSQTCWKREQHWKMVLLPHRINTHQQDKHHFHVLECFGCGGRMGVLLRCPCIVIKMQEGTHQIGDKDRDEDKEIDDSGNDENKKGTCSL